MASTPLIPSMSRRYMGRDTPPRKEVSDVEKPVDLNLHQRKILELQREFRKTGKISLPSKEISRS